MLKLEFNVLKGRLSVLFPGMPLPGIPDLGLDEIGIDHLKKNFSELASKAIDDRKQDAADTTGGGLGGGGMNSNSVASSNPTAGSTISSAISKVEWEKEGLDNEAYALVKEILADVGDTHVEHTGLQQVTPLSGPNQGTTRWVWKDSAVVDCYEKERNPGEKAFHAIEVAKKKRGGEGL